MSRSDQSPTLIGNELFVQVVLSQTAVYMISVALDALLDVVGKEAPTGLLLDTRGFFEDVYLHPDKFPVRGRMAASLKKRNRILKKTGR